MIKYLLNKLKNETRRGSLDQSFDTIYKILKANGSVVPSRPRHTSLFQTMNTVLRDGESFSVPIEIKDNGALGIAAMFEGEGDITITHGDHDLYQIGKTVGDGVMGKLYRSESDELHGGNLTITYHGTGTYGPAAFYFAEESQNIVDMSNYIGEASDGNSTSTLSSTNSRGGKFVHLAAWTESDKGSPPLPRPKIQNPQEHEVVVWGEAAAGTPIILTDFIRGNCMGGKWTQNSITDWTYEGDYMCDIYFPFDERPSTIGIVAEIDFEVDDPDNMSYLSFTNTNGVNNGWGYNKSGMYYREATTRNPHRHTGLIISARSIGKVHIRIQQIVTDMKSFCFAIGHSTVPNYDGQEVSYEWGIASPNVIVGAEINLQPR